MTKPTFSELLSYQLPITGVISILHRISGLVLFLCLPFLFWMAHQVRLGHEVQGFGLWLGLSALYFHALTGFRHMLCSGVMGRTYRRGYWTAWVFLPLAFLVVLLIGVWVR